MSRFARPAVLPFLLAALGPAGCGSSAPAPAAGPAAQPPARHASRAAAPTVLAAASLSRVLPEIYPQARYTFGGSGILATDIEQGARADAFASASPKQVEALVARGLIGRPVRFATNTLVLIVPRANPAHVRAVGDLARPGVKLVVCAAAVPCGDYARGALGRLRIAASVMRNVVSQTADVTQTVAQVALGQADAGFAYVTDARAARGRVLAIALPARAKPRTEDLIAVLRSAAHAGAARALVAALLSPAGQARLRAAGFGAP